MSEFSDKVMELADEARKEWQRGGGPAKLKPKLDALRDFVDAPIPMVLFCPKCGLQHIDRPETEAEYTARLHESSWWELGGDKPPKWDNRPHKSHKCAACGHIWRPCDRPTTGVQKTLSRGQDDHFPVVPDQTGRKDWRD